jgi:predicted esterase
MKLSTIKKYCDVRTQVSQKSILKDGNLISRAKDMASLSVLLVHGTRDSTVHISHSMALAKVQNTTDNMYLFLC